MRNALFNGPATKWLRDVVKDEPFLRATDNSLSAKTMRDREAVNRFVSFALCGWENYSGSMDGHLAEGLRQLADLSDDEKKLLLENFNETMDFCFELFGKHSFRKSVLRPESRKSLINMSLFDVMSVKFAQEISNLKKINKANVVELINNLLNDDSFNLSITISTNDRKAVHNRFQEFENSVDKLIKSSNRG